MLTIPIDHYDKGFKIQELTCIDIPLAAACGAHNYLNYFLYSGLYTLNANFNHTTDWKTMHARILRPLGLELIEVDISKLSDEQIWNVLIHNFKNNNPAMFVVKEMDAFYVVREEDGVTKEYHGVILNGVDEANELLLLQDCRMQADLNSKYMTGQAFTSLKLKRKDVIQMLRSSVEYWTEQNLNKYAFLFFIAKTHDATVNSWATLLSYWENKFDFSSDLLVHELDGFYKNCSRYVFHEYIYDIRNTTHIIFETLLKVVQMIIIEYRIVSVDIAEYQCFCNDILCIRSNAIAYMHKTALRGTKVDKTQLNQIVSKIKICNTRLSNIVKTISSEIKGYGNNLSIDAYITADSEQVLPNHVVRYAKNVANLKHQDWMVDSWQSIDDRTDHWLLVDFGTQKHVKKILLRHLAINMAPEYRILTSVDGITWSCDCVCCGNREEITSHILNNECRFVKYYVPYNGVAHSAALWELDIYGD